MPTFYEFFAGGGMARIGLGDRWHCLFANDISVKKAAVYRSNFADRPSVLQVVDVGKLKTADLPGCVDLAWGSFPCQDLSLAGNGAGLDGRKSGVFWPFWRLIRGLNDEGRGPTLVVLENVTGALTSHGGADFRAIIAAIVDAGYCVGALTVNAAYFLPQSRPRLFFVAVRADRDVSSALLYRASGPKTDIERVWHSDRLTTAYKALPQRLKAAWFWWRMPVPGEVLNTIGDLLEPEHKVTWHSEETTQRILNIMSPIHLDKLRRAQGHGVRTVGTIYKRTRSGNQRAEVRFDGISGCLRTPEGGSSRQTIIEVDGSVIRSRLLTTREAARLMGIPDSYLLPSNYNEAYHIAGDGVAVPVVSWIERHLLWPLTRQTENEDVPLEVTADANWELFANV